jgi:hypothetical protein
MGEGSAMSDDIVSRIKELKTSATQLKTDRVAAEKAEQKRDQSLHDWLESVRRVLTVLLRDKTNAKKRLPKQYGKLPKAWDSSGFLIKLAYPYLEPGTRSKYAAVVRYAVQIEWKGTIEKLVQENGGINGCVDKESKLRKDVKAKQKAAAKVVKKNRTGFGSKPTMPKDDEPNQKTGAKGYWKRPTVGFGPAKKSAA